MHNDIKGAGGSGKSTVLKQMKIIHHHGFSLEEKNATKDAVYANIVTAMRAILSAMITLKIKFENPENLKNKEVVEGLGYEIEATRPPDSVMDAIKMIWSDNGVQKCILHSSKFHLDDSAK